MHTIHKYPVPVSADAFLIVLPKGAKFLAARVQCGHPHLWFEVDSMQPMEKVIFCLIGTGQRFPEIATKHHWPYLDTFLVHDGMDTLHLYGGVPFAG
jgi:hypothetical protein